MEKKEPTFSPRDASSEPEARPNAASVPAKREKKSLKSRTLDRLSAKQKRFLVALVICLIVIGIMVWTISLFGREKSNVATLEPAKREKAAPVEGKGSWLSRLFSKKEEAKAEVKSPSFDIVRMEKGEVVIAGRANPDDVVHILDNGVEIGSEKADENGQWVFIPKKALPVGNRKLSLYVIVADGVRLASKESAVLRVSKGGADDVAVIMGGEKSKVLKAPKGQDIGSLRVEKIDYTDKGGFKAEGRADKGATVNVYLNGSLIGKAVAGAGGMWRVDSDGISLSDSKQVLRADQLGSKGKVARRVEYKFTPILIDGEGSMTVIKKGDCLWNLAVKEYGRGASYVVIFEANKSQIKNPDLIYVGQVFSVPKKDGEAFKAAEEKRKASVKKKAKKK
jgi:hypothetical protein